MKGWRRSTRSSSATRCATWVKLGFAKEGNIPGFYKRSDAFLLGCTVPPPGRAKTIDAGPGASDVPSQSEIRLAVAEPSTGPAAMTPAQERMRADHPHCEEAPQGFRQGHPVGQGRARRRGRGAQGRGRRASQRARPHRVRALRPRRRAPLLRRDRPRRVRALRLDRVAGLLRQRVPRAAPVAADRGREARAPSARSRRSATSSSAEGVVSCFSLAPSDDLALATAFLHNGFRRTGLLLDHLVVGERAQGRDPLVAQAREPERRVGTRRGGFRRPSLGRTHDPAAC